MECDKKMKKSVVEDKIRLLDKTVCELRDFEIVVQDNQNSLEDISRVVSLLERIRGRLMRALTASSIKKVV